MKITMCCAFWRCALGFCVFFIVFMGAPVPEGCSQMSAGVEGKGSAHCVVVLVAISGLSHSFMLLLVLFLITLLDNQVTNKVSLKYSAKGNLEKGCRRLRAVLTRCITRQRRASRPRPLPEETPRFSYIKRVWLNTECVQKSVFLLYLEQASVHMRFSLWLY